MASAVMKNILLIYYQLTDNNTSRVVEMGGNILQQFVKHFYCCRKSNIELCPLESHTNLFHPRGCSATFFHPPRKPCNIYFYPHGIPAILIPVKVSTSEAKYLDVSAENLDVTTYSTRKPNPLLGL